MKTIEVIKTRRTIRSYTDKKIPFNLLEEFVDAARLAPQAANRQPLEFIVVDELQKREEIFENIKMGGYINWKPTKKEQPSAYIVIIANIERQKPKWICFDAAFAAENIAIAAWSKEIGSCVIGAFNKTNIKNILDISMGYDVALVIALGYPAHESVYEDNDEDVKYWVDEKDTFHVPKRPLKKVIHRNKF